MIGRNVPRAIGEPGRYSERADVRGDTTARQPSSRYSRRVALLKVVLPAIGLSLLLLVVVWPRVAPLFDRLRMAAIDLREARELKMINPRYAGTDRDGHPFVLTAAIGRQVPQRDDVMALDQPVANLQSHSGAKIVVTADSGVYQTQSQLLDMFGTVTVTHENGTEFVTTDARLDVANDAAEGHNPIEGHGPQGDVSGQGFQILGKGDIVIFTGQSHLLLKSAKEQTTTPEQTPAQTPPAFPAPIAEAAAQIEATAEAQHILSPPTAAAEKAEPAPHGAGQTAADTKPPAQKPD
jgi:lipopolysaccharide export system protein LptC